MKFQAEIVNAQAKAGQKGGVALEYVLVTTFAAIVGVSLLGLAAKVFKNKIEAVAVEAGIEIDDLNWNPFSRE